MIISAPKCISCKSYIHDCYPNIEITACEEMICTGCSKGIYNKCHKCNKKLEQNHFLSGSMKTIMIENIFEKKYVHDGCKTETDLKNMQEHIKTCELAMVPCIYGCSGCLRKDMATHLRTCTHRIVPCEFCSMRMKHYERSLHSTTCPERIIQCVFGCGESYKAIQSSEHEKICPNVLTECTYCKGVYRRSKLPEHDTKCDYKPYICTCKESILISDKAKHDEVCIQRTIICPLDCKEAITVADIPMHLKTCPNAFTYCATCKNQYRNGDCKLLCELGASFSNTKSENITLCKGGLYDLYHDDQWYQICVTKYTDTHMYFMYINKLNKKDKYEIKTILRDIVIAPYLEITNCFMNVGDMVIYNTVDTLGTAIYNIEAIDYMNITLINKLTGNKKIVPKTKQDCIDSTKEYTVGSLAEIHDDNCSTVIKILEISTDCIYGVIINEPSDMKSTDINFMMVKRKFIEQLKYYEPSIENLSNKMFFSNINIDEAKKRYLEIIKTAKEQPSKKTTTYGSDYIKKYDNLKELFDEYYGGTITSIYDDCVD